MAESKCFGNRKTLILKDETVEECLVVLSYVQTLKHKVEQQLLPRIWLISAASGDKQAAVSGLFADVELLVLVS